ncbi:MAG: TlpA family protein disulfide reductase [Clostridia bacterium]|nr:TlpA family protein disulfide reductase [Clostridia bacterium]
MKKILSIILTLVLLCGAAMAGGVEFSTVDMEGNVVNQEIFADYDITMVNVWATWCGYCLEEMPSFVDLKNSLPENANLITICDDAGYETELVNMILDLIKPNFPTLVATNDMYSGILGQVYAFPTTLFFDRDGNMVGEAVVGVPSLEDPAGAYYDIIMERLASIS